MDLPPFRLERYFAQHEFQIRHLLSASDCESYRMDELLALADGPTLEGWRSLSLGYTETAGHPLLRSAIAALYEQVKPGDVLTAIPAEGIFLALHAALRPGDHVIALFPAYQSLSDLGRGIGCEVTRWPVRLGARGWYVDLDELRQSVRPQTRLLIINFPHNPTGHLPSPDELRGIIAIAEQHGLWIFSDEMYRLLEYRSDDRLPAICDVYERGISLSGLSKAFGLPGLRVGWLVTRAADLLARCQQIKDYTTICGSAPSEILALVALGARQAIIERNLAIVRRNLDHAEQFMRGRPEQLQWIPPRAGSVAFPAWRGQRPLDEIAGAALAHGVMMVPGALFDVPSPHFRIGLGRRSFPDALSAFAGCLP